MATISTQNDYRRLLGDEVSGEVALDQIADPETGALTKQAQANDAKTDSLGHDTASRETQHSFDAYISRILQSKPYFKAACLKEPTPDGIRQALKKYKSKQIIKKLQRNNTEEEICTSVRRLMANGALSSPPKDTDGWMPVQVDLDPNTITVAQEARISEEAPSDNSRDFQLVREENLISEGDTEPQGDEATDKDHPTMIPFDTQYTIMTELQSLLEQTCFAHAKRTMPFVLSRRRWDFACSANLASWADLFRKTKNRLLPDVPDTKFECLAESMVGILNAAVNRTPMPWSRMSNYFQHAELLAISLGESEYAQAIQALFIEVSEVVSLLAGNEIDVRRTVRKELAELAVTRERILQKEVDVKESFLVEMERLQKRSKAPIMEAVRKAAELRLSQQSAD